MTKDADGYSHGQFERRCTGFMAAEADCSCWEAGIPPEQWDQGNFHVPMESSPAVESDCSSWGAGPPVWLELVIRFADHLKPTQVMAHVSKLIGRVAAAAPDLRLTYDPARSRNEGEEVVVALVPATLDGLEERLKSLVESIQGSMPVRVGRAA